MENSSVSMLSLAACLLGHVSDAINDGLPQEDVGTALNVVQQVVGQVGPSEQKKTGSQPGAVPRK